MYLTAVIDLCSRMVVGWAMNASMATELVLDALTMALWRRRPTGPVMIYSDQGSQFARDDFARWCKDNQLVPSMSRRVNCWNNAVAESFFSSLKKERIKRHIYATRQDAKSDVFDYIEGFYNRIRRHSHLDQLSPLASCWTPWGVLGAGTTTWIGYVQNVRRRGMSRSSWERARLLHK